jgi:hypothetical protein
MSKGWQNWMSAWAIFVVIFGLAIVGGAFEATDGACRLILIIFGNPMPETPDQLHRFALGLMGAVTMGWGMTFYGAFRALHKLEQTVAAPIWRLLIFAMITWYLIDSAISCATGYSMNAVSNTLVTTGFLIPILKSGVWRER